jgi:hypothetical protein
VRSYFTLPLGIGLGLVEEAPVRIIALRLPPVVSRAGLFDAAIDELINYFSDARVTRLTLQEWEAQPEASKELHRACVRELVLMHDTILSALELPLSQS